METLLRLVLTNAAAAAVVAAAAFAASRLVRRPALAHAFWLLALVKLVTPPLLPLPLLPAWPVPALSAPASPIVVPMAQAGSALPRSVSPPATPTVAGRARDAASPVTLGRASISPARERPAADATTAARLMPLAALGLALGAAAVLALAAWRFARFRRLLAWAEPAPPALAARTAVLATRLGLRRVPPVLVVPARIPPVLWPEPTGPRLLLPRDLLAELREPERDALLAHELAHVHRRDHWVRLVELAATALFWWYPLTWWARASLRRAEERCCDEWVLRVLPRSAEAYAQGLLKSLTFVSSAPASVPALASGASPLYELELRLKEILMSRPAPRLARPLRLALLAAAAVSLAVFPTHARDEDAPRAAALAPAREATPAPAAQAAPVVQPAPAAATPARSPAPARAPRPARTAATAPALAAVQGGVAVGVSDGVDGGVTGAVAGTDPRHEAARRQLEAAHRELDYRRQEIETKRRALQQQEFELQRQEIELQARAEQDELRAAAERLRAEGKAREAQGYEKRLETTSRRADLQRRQLALEAERMALEAKLEAAERAQRDLLDKLTAAGNEAGLIAAQRAMGRAEAERREAEQETEAKQRAIEVELQAMEKQEQLLAAEQQIHAMSQATEDMARSLAEQLEALRDALRETGTRPDAERELARLEAALAALRAGAPPRSPGPKTPRPTPEP